MTITEQSVSPRCAGLATRTLAFAADAAFINAAAWLVGVVVAVGLSLFTIPKDVATVLAAIGAFLALVWAMGYFVFFWSSTGQTPGNRVLGITVCDAVTLEPLTVRRAFLRLLALPLSVIPFLAGFLMILVDDRRRALHDRIVHSLVIYAPLGTRTAARRTSPTRTASDAS